MNKQEKLTGYLLILAAITFWISWELAIHISSSLFLMIKIITNFQKHLRTWFLLTPRKPHGNANP